MHLCVQEEQGESSYVCCKGIAKYSIIILVVSNSNSLLCMQSSKQTKVFFSVHENVYREMYLHGGNQTLLCKQSETKSSSLYRQIWLQTQDPVAKYICLSWDLSLSLSLGVMWEFEQQWHIVHRSLVQLEVELGLQTSSSGQHQRLDVAVESLVHPDNAHMQNTKPTNHCQYHQQTSSTPMCLISLQERKKSTSPSAPGGWSINQ
jgi:hypothetical protein